MAKPGYLAVLNVSESFASTVADVARDLDLEWVEVTGASWDPPPDTLGVVVLAGGEEPKGLAALDESRPTALPTWMIGASTDHRIASAAIRHGAQDYFAFPADLDLFRRTLARATSQSAALEGATRFAAEERAASGFDAIVGRSRTLLSVLEQARRVAAHGDVTVLIGGETGTGKELLARAIHYHSPRARAPFVEINCAALPAQLLESELFGHEKGAFTGAVAMKPGLFELADGGTIFLDEIGHLPLELQPKLLRALESRTIRRVGGRETRAIDVRVVSATHVGLREAVERQEFREDLFYRLNVVALELPPLRNRDADVELLADAFVERLARAYRLPVPALTAAVRGALRAYHWPGNIRELKNTIERALVLSAPGTFQLEPLATAPTPTSKGSLPFPASLRAITRAAALAMLEHTRGNKSEAARLLDVSRPRLQRLLNGDPE